ncbi:hypothetical protein K431DRAFT_165141 [Polychaeton citri CBS 116435]|uniref:Uncharacterized protein n=1 Tax=Polychaeton citri CBS 116435 TaxID=1314669 RepID=A0A9P4QFV2_9PEZI|nr:hypothetical protein K431DRAFT_165141 [Polychaeton citri CBS 116435]
MEARRWRDDSRHMTTVAGRLDGYMSSPSVRGMYTTSAEHYPPSGACYCKQTFYFRREPACFEHTLRERTVLVLVLCGCGCGGHSNDRLCREGRLKSVLYIDGVAEYWKYT